jgi:hypothetical protein
VEKLEKNERKLKKQLKIYMKKAQDLEGRVHEGVCMCTFCGAEVPGHSHRSGLPALCHTVYVASFLVIGPVAIM